MLRKILMILAVSLFVFGVSKVSWAMNCQCGQCSQMQLAQADTGNMQMNSMQMNKETAVSATTATESAKKAEDVGNKICPVSGEKIAEKTKATYEYQGKIYNFCCPMCIDEFKKDPEKYIKKVEEELQGKSTKSEAAEKTETKATEETEHHHGHGM